MKMKTACIQVAVLLLLFPLYSVAGPLDIRPKLLDTAYQSTADGGEKAALNSGVDLSFDHRLLNLSLDYHLKGAFDQEVNDSDLSQVIQSALRSATINDILHLDAVLKAKSVVRDEGDSYRHRLSSELSKQIPDLADINARYSVLLDKASPSALEKKTVDYSLRLGGEWIDGRLEWHSGYRQTLHNIALREDTSRVVNFSSRYTLLPEMHLDISGAHRRDARWSNGGGSAYEQLRFGAGLSWELARDYALSFKVNRHHDSRIEEAELFGSGSILWSPPEPWELELSYDDHLVDGLKGVMLRAKLDLFKD